MVEERIASQLEALLPKLISAALQPLRQEVEDMSMLIENGVRDLSDRIYRVESMMSQAEPRREAEVDAVLAPSPPSAARVHAVQFLEQAAPRLDGRSHKGQCGRIGVLGGSIEFAGAPYYAGVAALRSGAELLYLCTAEEASPAIKSFSPELMVTPAYSIGTLSDPACVEQEQQAFLDKMSDVIPRLHSLCLGPGLGRHEAVLATLGKVIELSRMRDLPLVIDADALWLVCQQPDIIRGYAGAVLTPNAMEYRLLAKATCGDENADLRSVCHALQGVTIIQKGPIDCIFSSSEASVLQCDEPGTPRRPGGIGDLLAGVLSTLLAWSHQRRFSRLKACHAACVLVRAASRAAYSKHHRAMVTPDIIEELGPTMQALCPVPSADR